MNKLQFNEFRRMISNNKKIILKKKPFLQVKQLIEKRKK